MLEKVEEGDGCPTAMANEHGAGSSESPGKDATVERRKMKTNLESRLQELQTENRRLKKILREQQQHHGFLHIEPEATMDVEPQEPPGKYRGIVCEEIGEEESVIAVHRHGRVPSPDAMARRQAWERSDDAGPGAVKSYPPPRAVSPTPAHPFQHTGR